MQTKLRSRQQKIRKLLQVIGIIVVGILVIMLIVGIIGNYLFNWDWIGLAPYTSPAHPTNTDFQRGKTLWDWLQLLVVPIMLVIGGFWLNQVQKSRGEKAAEQRTQVDHDIALDSLRENELASYFDKMSELLLHENLRESDGNAEVRNIARALTLTVLHRLDADRKGSLIQFLNECGLIKWNEGYNFVKGNSIISMKGADLTKANVAGFDLNGVDLRDTDLSEANMVHTDLTGANLRGAILKGTFLIGATLTEANLSKIHLGTLLNFNEQRWHVNLSGANLHKANLSESNLGGADLSGADLSEANLSETILYDANLSNSTKIDNASRTEQELIISYNAHFRGIPGLKSYGEGWSGDKIILNLTFVTGSILRNARVTQDQLAEVASLQGAIMPDGTKHT